MRTSNMHYLVSYDIQCNRIRCRVAKTLDMLGVRIQYSVFELYITQNQLTQMFKKLNALLEPSDSLRCYYLHPKTRHKNLSNQPDVEPQIIVVW